MFECFPSPAQCQDDSPPGLGVRVSTVVVLAVTRQECDAISWLGGHWSGEEGRICSKYSQVFRVQYVLL